MLSTLQGKEKETLYIIGNGFDLYHGVKSKYKHFYCWLNLNDHEEFVNEMEMFFPRLEISSCSLWSNFEQVLNKYIPNDIYQQLREHPDNPWNESELDKAVAGLNFIVNNMRPLMKDWAEHIDTQNVKQKLPLSKESLYLTFNYTKILEDVYTIPQNHICHIHGSIDSNEVIVGHNLTTAPDYYKKAKTPEEERVCERITEIMQQLNKRIKKNITESSFFDSLQNITNVVVIGHSMSSIDLPYFCEISERIVPNSCWYFSSYKNTYDIDMRIQSFINYTSFKCRRKLLKEYCKPFELPIC